MLLFSWRSRDADKEAPSQVCTPLWLVGRRHRGRSAAPDVFHLCLILCILIPRVARFAETSKRVGEADTLTSFADAGI